MSRLLGKISSAVVIDLEGFIEVFHYSWLPLFLEFVKEVSDLQMPHVAPILLPNILSIFQQPEVSWVIFLINLSGKYIVSVTFECHCTHCMSLHPYDCIASMLHAPIFAFLVSQQSVILGCVTAITPIVPPLCCTSLIRHFTIYQLSWYTVCLL